MKYSGRSSQRSEVTYIITCLAFPLWLIISVGGAGGANLEVLDRQGLGEGQKWEGEKTRKPDNCDITQATTYQNRVDRIGLRRQPCLWMQQEFDAVKNMFSLPLFIPRLTVFRHGVPQAWRERRAWCVTGPVWKRIMSLMVWKSPKCRNCVYCWKMCLSLQNTGDDINV